MNKKESEVLNEIFEQHKKISIGIWGDEQLGIEGLINSQKKDDQFRIEARQVWEQLLQNQQTQLSINEDIEARVRNIENFYLWVKGLTGIKRKTILIILGSGGALGTIIAKFEAIVKVITGN